MDLIRTFAETAFVRVAERYLTSHSDAFGTFPDKLMIDEPMFVDETRIRHPEFTDDQIRTIYSLYRDSWSYAHHIHGLSGVNGSNRNIFNVLFLIVNDFLRFNGNIPVVKFKHLFRWRELTQLMGENLLTCAALALNRKDCQPYDFKSHGALHNSQRIDFGAWPTVLHNDNPHLKYIFSTLGLCELHSHLNASTDNFGLTWVCLMNHISGRTASFEKLSRLQDPSRFRALSEKLYSYTGQAARIRLHLWRYILDNTSSIGYLKNSEDCLDINLIEFDKELSEERTNSYDFDYISDDPDNPMNVFAGERMLLFGVFERILRSDDILLLEYLYKYILLKNTVRAFFVQVNDNRGFNNFKRFQDLKAEFLLPHYRLLLSWLPLWEARQFNYATKVEARIVPPLDRHMFSRELRRVISRMSESSPPEDSTFRWSYIFHFIKIHDSKISSENFRDLPLRRETVKASSTLRRLLESDEVKPYLAGIDAASAELACRPEVFAPTFRYLKNAGYNATFHVGEDFYDIADGLRAIGEAIDFLGLESGDRLGHAVALGIDAPEFYTERHNYIVLPRQWFLDNTVWMYFFAKKLNIVLEPQTEAFLGANARQLLVELGYEKAFGKNIDLYDYYLSMKLRGDDPELYRDGAFSTTALSGLPDGRSIHSFSVSTAHDLVEVRRNANATRLYWLYHFDSQIKESGEKVISAKIPEGYIRVIDELQNGMMSRINRLRIGIECCPSSNLKIGNLHRFDRHPIFRFMPVDPNATRFPLAVTVNTDDLGIFATSLPNEFSLLALALIKARDIQGKPLYNSSQIYDWIKAVVENAHKFCFPLLSF